MKKLLFLICCLPFLSGCFEEEYTVQNSTEFFVMIDDEFFNRDGPCDIDIGDKVKFLKGSPKICKGGTDRVTLENLSIKKTCRLKCMEKVTTNEQSQDKKYIERVSEKWATMPSHRDRLRPIYINLETSKITRDEDGRKKVYVETMQEGTNHNSLDTFEISCLKPETLTKMSKNQGTIAWEYTENFDNHERKYYYQYLHKKYDDELKVRFFVAKHFPLADKFGEGSDFRLFEERPNLNFLSEEDIEKLGPMMSTSGALSLGSAGRNCHSNELIKNQRDKNPELEISKKYGTKHTVWFLETYNGEKESKYVKNQYCDVTYDMFDEKFEKDVMAKNIEDFRSRSDGKPTNRFNYNLGSYCSEFFESFLEKAKKLKF